VRITQWATEPFEEQEVELITPGFSVYVTMASGQRFRLDESPGGGLRLSAEGAVTLHPLSLNSVSVDEKL
jgi:hypothetical protein